MGSSQSTGSSPNTNVKEGPPGPPGPPGPAGHVRGPRQRRRLQDRQQRPRRRRDRAGQLHAVVSGGEMATPSFETPLRGSTA